MHLTVTRRPGAAVAAIEGEFLGVLHGPEFTRAVSEIRGAGQHRLVLDLRACTLMDSAGLGALIDAATALRAGGGDLRVVAREGRLLRLFEMTGLLGRVFAVFDTLEGAIAEWDRERSSAQRQ